MKKHAAEAARRLATLGTVRSVTVARCGDWLSVRAEIARGGRVEFVDVVGPSVASALSVVGC